MKVPQSDKVIKLDKSTYKQDSSQVYFINLLHPMKAPRGRNTAERQNGVRLIETHRDGDEDRC